MDLGLAAKIRPCLGLSIPTAEMDRSLATVVPHTTSLRGTRFEVTVSVPFLRIGGFDAQGIVTVPTSGSFGILVRSNLNRSTPL